MSKARERYNTVTNIDGYDAYKGLQIAKDYISELEAEKSDLMSDIFNIKNNYEKLEAEKAELLELLQRLTSVQTKDGWLDTMLTPVINKFKEK